METTFMTIHNLTPEANILYASESIVDILGFQPEEVIGKSCFDYFHPNEVPGARVIHGRGVEMDKAAVLHYARIINRDGSWISCECVFSVVFDHLVACTSIYKGDANSAKRATDAPAVRRLFASSPRDPRYHMLEHLSAKFRAPPRPTVNEPRAALILNRFTRSLAVMYATDALKDILGVTAEQVKNKSFYECMQEDCLQEAIRCLESAKANDSIAYLRFWSRDPRHEEDIEQERRGSSFSSDSEDGGVELTLMDIDDNPVAGPSTLAPPEPSTTRTSSAESTDIERDSAQAIFGEKERSASSASSLVVLSPEARRSRSRHHSATHSRPALEPVEIEAVVSCTSDGLVVILRRARAPMPSIRQASPRSQYANGLFAAPWGANPIRPHVYQPDRHNPFQHGFGAPLIPAGGPPQDDFMKSIRDVAVFAWALVGINGNTASYAHGTPRGQAQPPTGIPIWDPYAQPSPEYLPPENMSARRIAQMGKSNEPMDGNVVPYTHHRQESLIRQQMGFHSGPMQSDQPAMMAQAPYGHQLAFHQQPQIQADVLNNAIHAHGDTHDMSRPYQQAPNPGVGGNQSQWY